MKNMLITILFMLATLAWSAAQQPGTSPSSQTPGANQSQPSAPDSHGQNQASNVTEGCLGGSDPNYTLTDSANVTYKLVLPPKADTSKLAAHLGESVLIKGDVSKTGTPSIAAEGIGRGTGKCPGSDTKGAPLPPKQ